MDYAEINARAIDKWVTEGWEWGIPISHEAYERACRGDWEMFLTPTRPVPRDWFPARLAGLRVLGLASGGGQQMPLFAAQGAMCTVLDYSERQLESERMVAEREGYAIDIVRADMTKPLPFPDGAFDLIVHPVANCYVEQVEPIFRECRRVLRPGGILLCGLDNGTNFITSDEERIDTRLPFNPLRNPEQMARMDEEGGSIQFSHTAEEQLGGQLKAGFRLTGIYEDTNGVGRLHELNIPSFWATRAVREE